MPATALRDLLENCGWHASGRPFDCGFTAEFPFALETAASLPDLIGMKPGAASRLADARLRFEASLLADFVMENGALIQLARLPRSSQAPSGGVSIDKSILNVILTIN